VAERVSHQVQAHAVDRQVHQGQAVAAAVHVRIEVDAGGFLQRLAVNIEQPVYLALLDALAQHEGQELGDVVLGNVQRGELPVVSTQPAHVLAVAQRDIARIEVVVDQRPWHGFELRPPVADAADEPAQVLAALERHQLRELLVGVLGQGPPQLGHLGHAGGAGHFAQPCLGAQLVFAAEPDRVDLRDATQRDLDVAARPAQRVVGGVHQHHVLELLHHHHVGLALVVAVGAVDLRHVAHEPRIGLVVDAQLAHVAMRHAGAPLEPVVGVGQHRPTHGRQTVDHQDHFFVRRFDLDHHIAVAVAGFGVVDEAQRNVADQLVHLARRQLGDDARAHVDVRGHHVAHLDRRIAHRLAQRRLEELDVQILATEPVDRTVAAQALVGAGKLARANRAQGGQIQRQAEPGDDLGEAVDLAGAETVDHLQKRLLARQVGAAAHGADDQARQHQAGVNALVDPLQVQLADAGLVHTRDVLSGGGKNGGDNVRHIDVEADHADVNAAGDEASVRLHQLIGGNLEHLAQDVVGQHALGGHADAATGDERLVRDLLVARPVGFDDEVFELDLGQVFGLAHDPLARLPGAGGGHVLPRRVSRLVGKVDVDHLADEHRLHRDQPGVARHQADLHAQVFDVVMNPVGECKRALHVAQHEQRDAHHALADHAGGDATRARHGGGAAAARSHQSALGRGQRRVHHPLGVLAAKRQWPGQTDRNLDRADHVLHVAGQALGLHPGFAQGHQRRARNALEPGEPFHARRLAVLAARGDLCQRLSERPLVLVGQLPVPGVALHRLPQHRRGGRVLGRERDHQAAAFRRGNQAHDQAGQSQGVRAVHSQRRFVHRGLLERRPLPVVDVHAHRLFRDVAHRAGKRDAVDGLEHQRHLVVVLHTQPAGHAAIRSHHDATSSR